MHFDVLVYKLLIVNDFAWVAELADAGGLNPRKLIRADQEFIIG